MKIEQLALAGIAAAVMFWPQIQAQLANLHLGAVQRNAPPPGGSGVGRWGRAGDQGGSGREAGRKNLRAARGSATGGGA